MGEGAGVVVLEELRARQGARREDLCRGDRLRPVGRRLSHHRARPRTATAPIRCMQHGAEARRHRSRATSTTSTRTAPRRRWATRSSCAPSSGCSAMPPASSSMSSTKSAIGHLLGAAGAVEAIFSVLAIRDNIAPPTLNLDNPSVETAIDLVPHKAQKRDDRHRAVELLRLRRHQRLARAAPSAPPDQPSPAHGLMPSAGATRASPSLPAIAKPSSFRHICTSSFDGESIAGSRTARDGSQGQVGALAGSGA